MYAVVRSGSKQQKVAVGDVIEIDKMDLKANAVGSTLTLPVVMVVDGETVTATGLDKAAVTVEILGATKGPEDRHPEVQEQDRLQEAPGSPPEVHPGQGHRHLPSEATLGFAAALPPHRAAARRPSRTTPT